MEAGHWWGWGGGAGGGSLRIIAWSCSRLHPCGAGFSNTQTARLIGPLRFAAKLPKKANEDV